MLNQKSVLARLLANENITVQQGNYQTAYFDVQNRVLGLPMWKEMSRDVVDMLIGHEVSHALFTPTNFNEYNKEGIPHSWYNIVEDVRIEKLILRKYPGLVANFKRGYYSLMKEQDLFGIKDTDVNELKFMDRLNIAAKARDLLKVEFSEEEMVYVKKAMQTETYDDVAKLCEEIYEWLKDKQEAETDTHADQMEMSPEQNEQEDDQTGESNPMPQPIDEKGEEEPEQEQEQPGQSGDEPDEEETEQVQQPNKGDAQAEEGEEEATDPTETKMSNPQGAGADEKSPANELEEASTDVAFNENVTDLVEDDGYIYAQGVTRDMADAMTVDYETLAINRRAIAQQISESFAGQEEWVLRRYGVEDVTFPESKYQEFLAETKRIVNLMVKEFEMRKSAYRTQRARTSTKGTLDVNKLHKYKYDDQLFKQATQLADAKNHGMMMLIDYSGSMHGVLPSVIRQLLALTMFCKRVNIPFEVYSFTSIGGDELREVRKNVLSVSPLVTHVSADDVALVELFNSSMPKRDYEEAFKSMFWQTTNRALQQGFETLGSTPLDESLMAMHYKIADFRKKHGVEKMNFITLTDGASNGINVKLGDDVNKESIHARRWGSYAIEVNGKIIKTDRRSSYYGGNRKTTKALIESIRDMGVNCMNYFVASRPTDVRNEIWNSTEQYVPQSEVTKARRDIRNDGVHVLDNNSGYNRRFILMGNTTQLDGEIDEVEVSSDMSAAKIAKAFKKSSDSKKKSRIVTQKFAEAVA